ncbi:ribulose phosphate epimerase [Lonsdalea britannica]|uniref:GFA family protein n=1 Tax=Lonsdalea britannica TaxID=1082704 RepID=UPI000A1FAF49|nr:GFA family protein [Lonsdalea britannica]OSN04742.1 ribulose phosphate epimerase [Lonsdalea britannica]
MAAELSGGCLCGYIQFKALNPAKAHSCSCDICQKQTGGQTVVWLEFASADVAWTGEGGQPSLYRSSEASSRAFCARCGSSLGAIDDAPTLALLTGVFDQQEDVALMPVSHSFEDMKPAWWRNLCPDATA